MSSEAKLLKDHHVSHAVVDVIENAKEYVVLATAYLRLWVHLQQAVSAACKRGVRVHCIIRDPDGSKRDRDKTKKAIETLKDLGVEVHHVERLHAKAYLNESEVIVTSFNLVGASQESIELGLRLTDPTLVEECFQALTEYCPKLDKVSSPSAVTKPARRGHCIGCGKEHLHNPKKPLCRTCYSKSKKGTFFDQLPQRSCHSCGKSHPGTLEKPLCYVCYKALSAEEKAALDLT